MKILRNGEIRVFLFGWLTLTVLSIFALIVSDDLAIYIFLIYSLLVGILFTLLSFLRYKKLEKLNQYLRELSLGKAKLSFEDLLEGELSILQSELYKLTVSIRQQNQQLQQDKESLSKSLADISHQLKTPLTSLYMMFDLMRDPLLDEHKRELFMSQSLQQLHRMKSLINSLLKMSRLESETVKFTKEWVNASQLALESQSSLDILMDIQSTSINTEILTDKIYCDKNWTQEAINNILKNAIEHSQPNTLINFVIKKGSLGYQIQITNVGNTIAPEDLHKIFTRFYKSKDAFYDSVGIGLSLSKQIIEQQNGFIDVTSAKNHTTFTITLPFQSENDDSVT
ncbi:MAG: two-component sensor histidine kinase [Firmicutes bacterium HGW-Firmicutes-10]|jgi:signal transduction histidine kinase|nr:MAG: two-component sensor histidine kinase [Firmicutes bacterium HGW-Firmicutes-10]